MQETTDPTIPQYSSTRAYKDNPNPKAKIGFVVFYAFQFYVQKNIYKHLADESEFIIDLTAFFPVRQPDDLVRDIVTLLQKHKVKYRILHYEDRFSGMYLEDFFSRYQALVSLWHRGSIILPCNVAKRKIHPLYGTGKELVMVHPSRAIFDLTLVYGKHSQKHCSVYGEAKIVGNPKFDDWFNNEVDPETVAMIRQKLAPDKKTVLYLPTHGDLCSIDQLVDQLKMLTEKFNVVVKLHYFTVREERERIDLLADERIILLKDDMDLLPLLKIADVVLSDNSSAIFDAMLADKPIVTTNFLDKEFLDSEHKKMRRYRRGKMGALTYSGSIEQVIKREGSVVTVDTPEKLADSLLIALDDENRYVEARKQLRNELFDFNDGKCGKRAADAIRELMALPELLERPIMYHALEAYKQSKPLPPYSTLRELQQKLTEYENLLSLKSADTHHFFSVILIDDVPNNLEESLRTIILQKYPVGRYEIIVLTWKSAVSVRDSLDEIMKLRSGVAITVLGEETGKLPLALLGEAVRRSLGDMLIFTTSRYFVPYDWLARYAMWLHRLPHLAALGGYEVPIRWVNLNRYSQYVNYSISRLIGSSGLVSSSEFYPVTLKSLYRNPMGILGNVAFKKSTIENFDFLTWPKSSWSTIELLLKAHAIKQGEIAFVPVGVTNARPKEDHEFKQENFRRGYLKFRRGESISLGWVMKEILLCSLSTPSKGERRPLRAVWTVCFSQWLGFRWGWMRHLVEPRTASNK